MSAVTPTDVNVTLTPTQRAAYLDRIGLAAPPEPTAEALAALHRAHLMTVPFENLDIGVRPIRLDLDSLVSKVVDERRGGYCYELNGLFAALLRSLGYAVHLVSARVALPDGGRSPEFDHVALLVTSPLLAEPHVADVGFGDAFLEPLPLREGFDRREGSKVVGLAERDGRWTYWEDRGEGREAQYDFTRRPRSLDEFAPRNEWQQTSPDSHFTQKRVTSLATGDGRVTLSDRRLITTRGRDRTERDLTARQAEQALAEHFGIVLAPSDPASSA